MRRKSKVMHNPIGELDFLKEKNKTLVKEIVEHKNSRKQLQEDLDYMVKEKFLADQKLLRLEKVCSEVKLKTKSCLDKIVDCSEDLTEIFGLLERINKIKQSQHTLEAESANLTELRNLPSTANSTEIRNLSSNYDVQKSKILNGSKNSYQDTIPQESSLTSKADKTVHSGSNLGNVTMTYTPEKLLNNDGQTLDNSHPPENTQESSSLHESSFVSRGGKTVLPDISNLEETDFGSETGMEVEDDMEDQTNLTPAGKVLSIIHEDWEESCVSEEAETPKVVKLPDVSSLMTLREADSDHSTSKRERLSFIKRKSIGSPLPSFNVRTNSVLRKSGGKQRSLSGAKKRLSLGENHTPLLEMTNPPASSTLLENRTSAPPLFETTLKATQDFSYIPELPKNTSTPIQSTLPSKSRIGKKMTRTICDEESAADLDSSISKTDKTSLVREKIISSPKANDADPGDITLRCSKRRRCPTIDPLQQYIEKSMARSRRNVKINKLDSYVHPDPSEDEQTVESPPKITNTSINKKTITGATGKRSDRGTTRQAADLKSVEKPRKYSESSEHNDNDEDLSEDTMVPNVTSSPPKKNTNQGDNTTKFPRKRKCEETEDTAEGTKPNTFDKSKPSADKEPNTEQAKEDGHFDKRKRGKYPSSKTVKKVMKRAKMIPEEVEGSKTNEREPSTPKIVQNHTPSQEDTSGHNVSASRSSTRPKKSPENLLQKYIESSKRVARKAKPTCLKEPNIHCKLRRC